MNNMVYFLLIMKKFFHGLILFAVLIGTFAPISFSAAPYVNIAAAGGEDSISTTFQKEITIEKNIGTLNGFNLITYVKYGADGTNIVMGDDSYHVRSNIDLRYNVKQISPTSKTIADDLEFDSTQGNINDTIFKNNTVTQAKQSLIISEDGIYEAYFWEDYNLALNDIISSKLRFELKAGEIVSQEVIKVASNVRGDTVPVFSKLSVVEPNPDKPGSLQFKFTFEYQNASKSTSDSVTDDLVLHIADRGGANPIDSPMPYDKKYNSPTALISETKIYDNGKQLEWYIYSRNFLTSSGKPVQSEKMYYTVGDATSNITADDEFDANAAAAAAEAGRGNLFCGEWSDLNIGCWIIHSIIQFVIVPIPSFVAIITGTLSDMFLKFSIDPSMYGYCDADSCDAIADGIRTGWSIIRDFANIGFIFSLFVAAFMLIMNKTSIGGTSFDPKRTVVRVVIMALLINFSLLFCRLIIQTADIFSNIMYNRLDIKVTGDGTAGVAAQAFQAAGIKSPSLLLLSKVNPQSIVTSDSAALKGGLAAYLIISLMSLFLYFIFIYLFAQMMFVFAGRIFGLWVGMILAPLAFVSYSIPFLEDNKYIGFENWIKNFTQLAFLTPVYLFFIYLTLSVLDINIGGTTLTTIGSAINTPESNWFVSVFYIAISKFIPVIAAVFIFMQGKKIATDMSGVVGEMVSKASGAVTGLALGAATGGMALAGRQTFGKIGSNLANKYSGSTGIVGSGLRTVGNKLGATTFDVRNNKWAMDKFGAATKMGGEQIDLGKRGLQEKGGFIESGDFKQMWQDRKARIEDEKATAAEKAAEERKLNPQSREAINQRNTERRLAAAKKAKEAEEAKIAAEAGSKPADAAVASVIDEETAEMTKNQARLSLIQSETTKKTQEQVFANIAAQKEKTALDAELQQIGNVSITDPQYARVVDINNRKQAIDAEQQTLQVKITTEKALLTAEKTDLEQKNAKLAEKVTMLSSMKGKTIDQVKHENEIAKLTAKDSPEGKEVAKIEKEIADKNKKIKELAEKLTQARKDGDTAKVFELDADIKKTRSEIQVIQGDNKALQALNRNIKELEDKKNKATLPEDIKKLEDQIKEEKKKTEKFGMLGKAKGEVEKKFGTKAIDDAIKKAEGDYKKSQSSRTESFDKQIADQNIQLTKDKFALDNTNKQNQIAYADDLMSRPTGAIAETIGVITGGRILGGAVNNANRTAAGKVYKTAVEGKKEDKKPDPKKKPEPKPDAKPNDGKKDEKK